MAKILAVCTSARKGTPKNPVESVELRTGSGIAGDAHAEPGIRQVSLLAEESRLKMREKGIDVPFGGFGENIVTEGIALTELEIGSELRIGRVRARITQIGKVCHDRCEIYRIAGECIMPREGVFVEILEGGTVRPGDEIEKAGK
jgi:MOSC domain-containing protein YiiM